MDQHISFKSVELDDLKEFHFYFKNKNSKDIELLQDELYQLVFEHKVQLVKCLVIGNKENEKNWLKKYKYIFGDQQIIQNWQHTNTSDEQLSAHVFGIAGKTVKSLVGDDYVCKSYPMGNSWLTHLKYQANNTNDEMLQGINTPLLFSGFTSEHLFQSHFVQKQADEIKTIKLKNESHIPNSLNTYQKSQWKKEKSSSIYCIGLKTEVDEALIATNYSEELEAYLQYRSEGSNKHLYLSGLLSEQKLKEPEAWLDNLQKHIEDYDLSLKDMVLCKIESKTKTHLKALKNLFKENTVPMAPLFFIEEPELPNDKPVSVYIEWVK